MAADYLFLDFENHEFAIAKRSVRSNLVQYKDRVKETWVRRPDNSNGAASIFEGNSVYATQNGCRFSSFGMAEVFFDVEKLYQVAAYKLAESLVRGRWLGAADAHPESQYTTWVRDHLLQPKAQPDHESPPSFLPESLTRLLLTSGSASRLDELAARWRPSPRSSPSRGAALARLLAGTTARSATGGRAATTGRPGRRSSRTWRSSAATRSTSAPCGPASRGSPPSTAHGEGWR